MTIRQSTIEDLPDIVALLKLSIGEALTPKTEKYFAWKHEYNPFGRSKVLLAIEDGKIVGLRAFMHWSWVSEKEELLAVRAVDTATDPAFQGKGIFKKLTLQAVQECKEEGVAMVFNSPNPISMQGYLKMGWSLAGRLPLFLGPGSILPRSFINETVSHFYNKYDVASALKPLENNWSLARGAFLHTPINKDYLSWRFRDCPVAHYGAVIRPGSFGFVFRLKKMSKFIELRICEAWTENDSDSGEAKRELRKLMRQIRPAMVSCAASPLFNSGKSKIATLFGPFKKGPVITIRPLAKENLNNFEAFSLWQPSLGAMELF